MDLIGQAQVRAITRVRELSREQALVFTRLEFVEIIQDGFGLVIPQALACGLPVICTTNTGGADIITEGVNGFVIPVRSVEILKERLSCLYTDSGLRATMSRAASEFNRPFLSWSRYGEAMIEHYRALLQACGN